MPKYYTNRRELFISPLQVLSLLPGLGGTCRGMSSPSQDWLLSGGRDNLCCSLGITVNWSEHTPAQGVIYQGAVIRFWGGVGEGTDKFKIVLFAKIHSFSLSMPALLTALFFNQLLVLIPYFFLKERKPLSQYKSAHEYKYSSVLPVFFLFLVLPLYVFPILSTSLSLLLSRGYSKERLFQEAFSVPATPS